MTNKDQPLPSDQYDRVIDELRKFSVMVDDLQRGVETVRGVHAAEARRCFSMAAARLQEAGYWFGLGIKNAEKAGKLT